MFNSSPIPQEKLNYLNSLLDKELENLRDPTENRDEESIKSSKMHNELLSLQSKIINMESKITKYNSHEYPSQDENETPMKNKFYENRLAKKKQYQSSNIKHKPSPAKPRLSPERVNNFKIEKNIENAESKLLQSKSSLQKMSQVRSKDRERSNQSNLHNRSDIEKDSTSLTRKLKKIKKQYEDEKQLLVKEKQKNQQLNQQVDQLNKKVKKLQSQQDRQQQMEIDFKKLQENFEKSEYIRQQQKNLIQNLKLEIEQLKKKGQKLQR